jgi:hypothetical protein
MHRGFKLTLNWKDEDYYQKGLVDFETDKTSIRKTLSEFIGKDGILHGSRLQATWFHQLEADIFLSHSHGDRKAAIALAGWITENFNLKVFIDSCIWDHSNDLLRLIDNHYCLNPGGKTYSYEKRNESTSHVHMMLSTALSMMIDKAECLFFLNTPNSIQATEAIDRTKSPWIYHEISISSLIRKRRLSEYRREVTKAFSMGGRVNESAMANYDLCLGHLQNLTGLDLDNWREAWDEVSLNKKYPLDELYDLFPVDKIL